MIKKTRWLITALVSRTPVLFWMLLVSALLHFILIVGLKPEARISNQASMPKVVFRINLDQDTAQAGPSLAINQTPQSETTDEEWVTPESQGLAVLPVDPQLLPKFYRARELDVLPKPVGEVPLQYPSTINDILKSGTVRLEIFIDENGEVLSLNLIEATPPGVFDQAAIDAFKNQLFEPGFINGKAVKSHIKMTVGFGRPTENTP